MTTLAYTMGSTKSLKRSYDEAGLNEPTPVLPMISVAPVITQREPQSVAFTVSDVPGANPISYDSASRTPGGLRLDEASVTATASEKEGKQNVEEKQSKRIEKELKTREKALEKAKREEEKKAKDAAKEQDKTRKEEERKVKEAEREKKRKLKEQQARSKMEERRVKEEAKKKQEEEKNKKSRVCTSYHRQAIEKVLNVDRTSCVSTLSLPSLHCRTVPL